MAQQQPQFLPDPKIKAAAKILRVLRAYAEDHNLEVVVRQVDEALRLLRK